MSQHGPFDHDKILTKLDKDMFTLSQTLYKKLKNTFVGIDPRTG